MCEFIQLIKKKEGLTKCHAKFNYLFQLIKKKKEKKRRSLYIKIVNQLCFFFLSTIEERERERESE